MALSSVLKGIAKEQITAVKTQPATITISPWRFADRWYSRIIEFESIIQNFTLVSVAHATHLLAS
jgi:hypothetical protein